MDKGKGDNKLHCRSINTASFFSLSRFNISLTPSPPEFLTFSPPLLPSVLFSLLFLIEQASAAWRSRIVTKKKIAAISENCYRYDMLNRVNLPVQIVWYLLIWCIASSSMISLNREFCRVKRRIVTIFSSCRSIGRNRNINPSSFLVFFW